MTDWYLIGPDDLISPDDLIYPDGLPGAPHGPVLTPTRARAGSRRPALSILLKAADGDWTRLGADIAAGVAPEGFTASANESGPDTCSFRLPRRADLPWADLLAFNPCEVEIDGSFLWGGRLWEAPLSSGGADGINVAGRGWQYHLDDDQLRRLYVATDLSRYRDQRSFPGAPLTSHLTTPRVEAGGGQIVLAFPKDYAGTLNEFVTATIDLGAALAKRVTVTWTRVGGPDANTVLYSRGSASADPTVAGDDNSIVQNASAGSTFSHTFSAARRYHHLLLFRLAGGTFTADQGVAITSVNLYGETAYEGGGASVLKADQVIKNVLTSGALPLLSQDTSQIIAGSFSIPTLAPDGYQTPRQLIDAANAYEGNLVGVDAQRQVFFRERDTVATVEAVPGGGFTFQDATTNSGQELYNRVIVQGTAPDGTPVVVIRTASVPLLDRQGFTRTATLNVGSPITTAAAQILGDIWLGENAQPKFKGTATFQGHGSVRMVSGTPIHPSQLLLFGGHLIRIPLVDPATGAWTRDCLIKSVRYDHDPETATVELDSERGNFQTLLERYGVSVNQALARAG